MEGLSNTVVHWSGVPGGADVKWLRYFIHSLILHDKKAVESNMAYMESMTFEMGKKQGYADLAAALEALLST